MKKYGSNLEAAEASVEGLKRDLEGKSAIFSDTTGDDICVARIVLEGKKVVIVEVACPQRLKSVIGDLVVEAANEEVKNKRSCVNTVLVLYQREDTKDEELIDAMKTLRRLEDNAIIDTAMILGTEDEDTIFPVYEYLDELDRQ